jgi:two-component system sensor histidine kinase SenX3
MMIVELGPALAIAAIGVALGVLLAVVVGRWRARRRSSGPPARSRPATAQPPSLSPDVQAVLDALGASGLLLDQRLHVLHASAAAAAQGAVRRGELALPELVTLLERARDTGRVLERDLTVPRGRSSWQVRHLRAHAVPMPPDRLLVILEDTTAEQAVDQVRRDFVANVSHELKTPIGAIVLLAEAIGDAAADAESVRRFAHRIEDESSRLGRLVNEIINLSRLQYDDPLESPEPVLVDDVVTEAMDRARVDTDAKHIRLVAGGDLGLTVLGHPEQLVQALGNLVENAVNYSPDHTRITIGVRRRDDTVEISVSDQGIGIAEEDLGRIFERFYRVDPARSRATGGTGLGLAIVKHVAAAHGGDVTVWSVPGAGSTFTLRLPTATASLETTDRPVEEAAP